MLSFEEIKKKNKSGEFIAVCSDGKHYSATYSPKYKTMFFCIPSYVTILGYLKK